MAGFTVPDPQADPFSESYICANLRTSADRIGLRGFAPPASIRHGECRATAELTAKHNRTAKRGRAKAASLAGRISSGRVRRRPGQQHPLSRTLRP